MNETTQQVKLYVERIWRMTARSFLKKNTKALSTVVAAIILIAVTVPVALAASVWMGRLTFSLMNVEEIIITDVSFVSAYYGGREIDVSVMNGGSSSAKIDKIFVDGEEIMCPSVPITLPPGDSETISIEYNWSSDRLYEVVVFTADGNRFPYVSRAELLRQEYEYIHWDVLGNNDTDIVRSITASSQVEILEVKSKKTELLIHWNGNKPEILTLEFEDGTTITLVFQARFPDKNLKWDEEIWIEGEKQSLRIHTHRSTLEEIYLCVHYYEVTKDFAITIPLK